MRSGAVAAIAAGRWVQGNVVNANWPFDVLEPPLAHVFENQVQSLSDVIAHGLGKCDPSRRGDAFQSRRNIDAVAQDVFPFYNDIAHIDAHSEFDSRLGRHAGVPSAHCTLNVCSAGNRVHHARKLDQHAVAREFDDAAIVLGDFPINQIFPQRL